MLVSKRIQIKNPNGIDVKNLNKIVDFTYQQNSDIYFSINEKQSTAKSLFALMRLDFRCGNEICIKVKGEDADKSIKSLIKLLDSI